MVPGLSFWKGFSTLLGLYFYFASWALRVIDGSNPNITKAYLSFEEN